MWLPDLQIREKRVFECLWKQSKSQRSVFLGTNFPRVYTNKYTKFLLY
jgi:hypothetical protein